MTLLDLAPILGVVMGSMLAFAVAILRYMHIDSIKNRELIENSSRENRELIEKNHREVTASLGDVRERLAHIEGFLKLGTPPPPGDDGAPQAAAA